MNKSRTRWLFTVAHAALFMAVAIVVWRVREPDIMLHQAITWYGGCGLFLWQLLPFGMITQVTVEILAGIILVVLTVQAIQGKEHPFPAAWNALLAFLYLFPFAVSTFGRYIGP